MKIKLSLRVIYLCLWEKENSLRLSNERSGWGGIFLKLNELRLSNERSGKKEQRVKLTQPKIN